MSVGSDAVVIGAGHNGLVAAILLAKAGWNVTVLERNDVAGGAVRTEEATLPGFKHDLMAMSLGAFTGSAFFREYKDELFKHGLGIATSPKSFGSVFDDGTFLGVSTDREAMGAALRALSPRDAEAWGRLGAWFGRIAPHLFPLLAAPMPSVTAAKALLGGTRKLGMRWPYELARMTVQSPREFLEERFERRELHALFAAWGMHLDCAPDVPGGAVFAFVSTMAQAQHGMAIGRGGARTLVDALVSMLRANGGRLVTGVTADRIVTEGGRAVAVLAGDERYDARRAVVANVTPRALYAGLLPGEAVPADVRERAERYRYGPGTLAVHLALDELPAWRAGEHVREYAYVHVGGYLEEMQLAYQQAMGGLLPSRPMLVVGQPTAVDPSRAPAGKHVLWILVRYAPARIAGDAAGEIAARDWDAAKEPFTERVLDVLEQHAPGLRGHILGRAALSPVDLERLNPNLVDGEGLGGSHHLMQNFFLRPFPGWSRYRTPVKQLYLCGASTWPGAGLGAGSGYLLGKMLA